jgi:hypothetical protein
LQRIWARTHSAFDFKRLSCATNRYHAAIIKTKRTYHASTVSSTVSNPRKLWQTVNRLLHRESPDAKPDSLHPSNLSNCIASFFLSKILKPRTNIQSNSNHASPHIPCHLRLLFYMMVTHSYVPEGFGLGVIILLIKDKAGNINSLGNYRAV